MPLRQKKGGGCTRLQPSSERARARAGWSPVAIRSARASMRGLALAHLVTCAVAIRPILACRQWRWSLRRAAVHAETRSGRRREGGGCAFDGAHASRFSSFLREARRSLQPVLLARRSLLGCEHHRRRSLRRSAVDAETKIGTAQITEKKDCGRRRTCDGESRLAGDCESGSVAAYSTLSATIRSQRPLPRSLPG